MDGIGKFISSLKRPICRLFGHKWVNPCDEYMVLGPAKYIYCERCEKVKYL